MVYSLNRKQVVEALLLSLVYIALVAVRDEQQKLEQKNQSDSEESGTRLMPVQDELQEPMIPTSRRTQR